MKIFFQLSAFILLITLVVIWHLTKKLNLYSETTFYKMLYFLTVGVVIDLVSTVIYMLFKDSISTTVLSIITTGYLLCIVVYLYYKALHFFTILTSSEQCKKISFPFAGYSLLQAVIIIASSEKFSYTDTGITYNSFGSLLITIFFVLHILIVITGLIINNKKIIHHFKKLFGIDCLIIIFGLLLEFVLKIDGSFNLVLAFDSVYSMSFIENPKGNINSEYNCFKQNVLFPFLEEKFEERRRCFIVEIGFGYSTTNNTIEVEISKIKKEIIEEFSSVPNTNVFIGADNSVYAICEDNIYDDFIADTKEMIEDKAELHQSLASIKIGITSCANILYTENELVLINHLSSCLKNIYSGIKSIDYKEVTKEIIDSIIREEEIKNKIVWALDNDKLEVFYQPIFSVEKNNFTTSEALARIRNENGTVLSPGLFIPIAERNGLIIQIGDRVYEKVCEFISAPSSKEYNLEFISINLSNAQCEDLNLASRYTEIAKRYNIDPSMIEFEINETDIVNIKDKVIQNMNIFAQNGFRVALDNYGNRESTIYNLLDFPLSSLKLDMQLIWNYSESEIQRAVSQTIIKIAHNLNIQIVAEGVETVNQLEDMMKQNVDFIQGFYFFVPMDTNDYKQFLRPTAFEVGGENVTAMDKINSIRSINRHKN